MLEFIEKIIALIKRLIALITGEKASLETDPDVTAHELPDPETVVCYYGCPNSKKAEKLQLGKKLYR
ncbi:MAG: hypothetical protein IJL26_13985 [Clostridia bacterium]|nr:hypothetical protein [Clostridia bacterium]